MTRRPWHHRTLVWVIIGLTSAQLLFPASFMAMALATAALGESDLVGLSVVTAVWALVPISFWVGALVSVRIGVRFVPLIVTAAIFLLPAWAVWNYTLGLEAEALLACQLIEGENGEIVALDTELCESNTDGSPPDSSTEHLDRFCGGSRVVLGGSTRNPLRVTKTFPATWQGTSL